VDFAVDYLTHALWPEEWRKPVRRNADPNLLDRMSHIWSKPNAGIATEQASKKNAKRKRSEKEQKGFADPRIKSLLKKLDAIGRTEASAIALKRGLIKSVKHRSGEFLAMRKLTDSLFTPLCEPAPFVFFNTCYPISYMLPVYRGECVIDFQFLFSDH
jgi:hypothetical protein